MKVIKRSGRLEDVKFDQITDRLKMLSRDLSIDPIKIARAVCAQIKDNITTRMLDELSATICSALSIEEPEYDILGTRILMDSHAKDTKENFVDVVSDLQSNLDVLGEPSPILHQDMANFVLENRIVVSDHYKQCVEEYKVYQMSMFGWKTLYRSYLLKSNRRVVERVEHLFYRVALFLHYPNLEKTKETFGDLMNAKFIHATPTLFHAGTKRPQCSSCFDSNTLVHTLRGPIPIKDVKIGDEVITHLGNVKKVIQTHKNPLNDRKMYQVSIRKTNKFMATEDHKLFVYDKLSKKNVWKEIQDLKKTDYVMIPKYSGDIMKEPTIDVLSLLKSYDLPENKSIELTEDNLQVYIRTKYSHNNFKQEVVCSQRSTPLNVTIPLNEDVMKFIGIWFGDGHVVMAKQKNKQVIRGIGITIHNENTKLLEFCTEIRKYFGIHNVTFHRMSSQNITQILFNCPIVGIIFYKLFGKAKVEAHGACVPPFKGFNGKRIHEDMYKYDDKLILSFLSGLISTDGCISREGTISLCMANKELMNQIYSLCRLHNFDVGQVCPVKVGKLTKTPAYCISVTNLRDELKDIWKTYNDDRVHKLQKRTEVRNQSSPIIDDNEFKYLQFTGKTEVVDYNEEYVYTLGVEDDHSYSIEGIIAQNCFLLGSKDDVDGIYKTIMDVAKISKWAGGIGVHITSIRGKNSYIRGTNGYSNGIMPMLKVYNDTSRYIDQCVHGLTKVFTKEGPKPIHSLEPHKDYVLQKTGGYELLEKKLEHAYKGYIYHVHMDDGTSFKITPEHPIYGMHGWNNDYEDMYSEEKKENYWIDVEDLQIGDKIAYPVPKYTIDVLEYSMDMMLYWGMLLGWGRLQLDNQYGDVYFPLSYQKEADDFKYFLSSHLIHYNVYLVGEDMQVRFYRSNNCPFQYSHMYNENGEKWIHSSIPHLPITKLIPFVKGLLLTMLEDNVISLNGFADSVKDQLSYIFTRLHISTRYHDNSILLNVADIEEQYSLLYYDNSDIPRKTLYTPRDFVYRKVEKVFKEQYEGVLYDLEFKKEHSYVIPSAILHNGGGKRKGSFAMYIEPWHCDIFDFVYAKRNVGNEDDRARDLFYGLWIPDLFMKRVETDGVWSLMCPNICRNLDTTYGKEFEELYVTYEKEGKFMRQIQARELWKEILQSQIETGLPYMLYKDSCNSKSNQKNLGTIRSSNLCTEIIQYSDDKEYAVCNLASINLSNCIKPNYLQPSNEHSLTIYSKKDCGYCSLLKAKLGRLGVLYEEIDVTKNVDEFVEVMKTHGDDTKTVPKVLYKGDVYNYDSFWNTYLKPEFDFDELKRRVGVLVNNMNKIIDKNFYPTKETKQSNMNHRPIGIGVQGLADLFCVMGYIFDSCEARKLNRKIFETIYFSALQSSLTLAKESDNVYSSFAGSPLSKGIFHYEMCHNFNAEVLQEYPVHDWDHLRKNIQKWGVANSLFVAPMPTASTSQILYQNECFEPFTSNLYVRRTLAGEFTIFNKYLVQDLRDMGIWNQETIDHLIVNKGSIIDFIKLPYSIRQIYRTAWEIPQKSLIEMAYERQWFIDQSQSFNLFVADPSLEKLTKMHFYGWKNGLKTGSYYIRTKPKHFSQNFTVDPKKEEEMNCVSCSG